MSEIDRISDLLQNERPRLKARGVRRLWIFGSLARRADGPDSDVDIAVEFAAGSRPTLVGFCSLKAELEEAVSRKVDLAEVRLLRPATRAGFERDRVRIF